MWWRKEDPQSAADAGANGNSKRSKAAALLVLNNGRSSQMRKQLIGRSQPTTPVGAEEPLVHVSETHAGIEVAFSDDVISSPENLQDDPSSPTRTKEAASASSSIHSSVCEGFISLQSQLWRCQAVHRAQFNISTAASRLQQPTKQEAPVEPSMRGFQLRPHRVPLFGLETQNAALKFDDVLFLLRSHDVENERQCVQQEVDLLSSEIKALEQDRNDLQAKAMTLVATSLDDTTQQPHTWPDIHRELAHAHHLPHKARTSLQIQRGLHLTVALHNPPAREAFMSKCGVTTSLFRKQKKTTQETIELGPDNCRDGGAAATIQHVALLKASSTDTASFFISKDKGKAFCWGLLPEKLFRRMKNAGSDPNQHASEIMYLATGTLGSYYAEFRNGECWWGAAAEDEQFHSICSDPGWDICRVAFGPCAVFYDNDGGKRVVTSWIIIGRDGRAAWRNIPARLHSLLERRLANASACCEVALGSGGAYFVRFLDGTTDYCLSGAAAEACHSLEDRGASIMSMALHPELSHDFIIRSSI